VSQAVFGAAAIASPKNSSLLKRLRIMKAWLLLFDIGTVLLLISLLKSLQKPIGYSIAYAWCPLVLKEIGNSGHLDSIAIFLTTFSIWLFVRKIFLPSLAPNNQGLQAQRNNQVSTLGRLLPVLFLALAIGAKIYAVVLTPLFVFVAVKRLGWKATVAPTVVFFAATILVAWPMLPRNAQQQKQAQVTQPSVDPSLGVSILLKY
jgi:hypothetical protein